MNYSYTENLIEAVVNYGEDNFWDDSAIIDVLVDCGVTEEDFKNCGYWDFVKKYFENK